MRGWSPRACLQSNFVGLLTSPSTPKPPPPHPPPLHPLPLPPSLPPPAPRRSYAQFNPTNALRRAKDFEAAGNKDKALEQLYEVLISRKMGRQWQLAHEQMMLKFIDLCVEFREARKCKEGLYFYRNLSSQQNVQSLEKVVSHLVELSMRRTQEARARTESATQLDNLEDLESEDQSPETLLMAGVTSEGSRDRAEREILVPWVRHMWDTYRNVLETLRNNPALENLYHSAATRAMTFCKLYSRGAEFRKLCNTLRNHWKSQKENALQPNGRIVTPEAVEKHLATRFVQLEHCADMSLWVEGFRTIGDIREIMEDMRAQPKPQLMASYYEKLARIFWVSENYLFVRPSFAPLPARLLDLGLAPHPPDDTPGPFPPPPPSQPRSTPTRGSASSAFR